MRTLNDYFIVGGPIADVQTADSGPVAAVTVPDAGKLVGVSYTTAGVAVDVLTTFDVMRVSAGTEADSGIDATMAVTAARTGGMMTLDGDVTLTQGDSFYIQSNAECTNNNTTIYVNYIIRRQIYE